MSDVRIDSVVKRFGRTAALDGVSLDLTSGGLLAVLGPSGCGKTTLLRCVAGFERLDAGEIELGGRRVAAPGVHLPSHRRQVAVVPQEGALFPHLDLRGNIGFGLSRRDRRARVEECLELVGLAGLGARMPHELSGGQQQRAAVARALAPRPPLVLLDEPFSALDAALRAEVRRDVRAALREDGATAVLVTHDQGEALSMADRIAVMRDGRILQEGEPAQVYRAPADAWVADFVGDAVLLPVLAWADGGTGSAGLTARTALGELRVHREPAESSGAASQAGALAMVRPEQIEIQVSDRDPSAVPAVVHQVAYHGHDALVSLTIDTAPGADPGQQILVRVPDGPLAAVSVGTRVGLLVRGPVRVYPAPVASA